MPVSIRRLQSGKFTVRTPHGVKAKSTTRRKAEAQSRLLRAVDHGWKPTRESAYRLVCNLCEGRDDISKLPFSAQGKRYARRKSSSMSQQPQQYIDMVAAETGQKSRQWGFANKSTAQTTSGKPLRSGRPGE